MGGTRDQRDAESLVHVLSAQKGKAERSFKLDAACAALCFASEDLLIAASINGTVRLFDSKTDSDSALAEVFVSAAPTAICSDAKGTKLAIVDEAGTLTLFELSGAKGEKTLSELWSYKVSSQALYAAAADEHDVLAVAGQDGVVYTLTLTEKPAADGTIREMPCGEGGIYSLCFSGDGRIVAGCGDGTLQVCYLEGAVDAEDRARDAAHQKPVCGLVYGALLLDDAERPLERRLYSAGHDGQLKSWQLDNKRKPRAIEITSAKLMAMAWAPAAGRAKADKRGGLLGIVDAKRRLHVYTINETGELASAYRLESELARLASDLDRGNQKVKEAAVSALAELREDDARKLLEKTLLKQSVVALRKAAAEALGRLKSRLSRAALGQALDDDDKGVRKAALAALDLVEEKAPFSAARRALQSRHPDLRLEAIKRLPDLRATSPLVPTLLTGALGDEHEKVRLGALDALYQLFEPLEAAQQAVLRGPADIRKQALFRLGRDRLALDGKGRDLLEAAFDDGASAVRSAALLVAIGSRPRLAVKLWINDPHTAKALAEAQRQGRFADELDSDVDPLELDLQSDDLQPLFAAMASRHADTALRGARCLALLGDGRASGALLQLSREGDVEIRRYAVEALLAAALALPEDDRLVGRLEWLLDDSDPTVRVWSFNGLQTLARPAGHEGTLDLAALGLRSAHEDVRVRALQLLAPYGDPKKVDAELCQRADALLGDALDDEAGKVRGAAFEQLMAWHPQNDVGPKRAAKSRHADLRRRVVTVLAGQKAAWADEHLLQRVKDASAEVALAAYDALTDDSNKRRSKSNRVKPELHLFALGSSRPAVRQRGCEGAGKWALADKKTFKDIRERLIELLADEQRAVFIAAIEALDALIAKDQEAFAVAFGSKFYELRVRAGELCGKRRDKRASQPMRELLTIPRSSIDRPSDGLRQRAARALADVGDFEMISFYVALLDDEDALVREMGGRGLAAACRPQEEQPLVDALAHEDLPVRSWAAEGLARLGDDRAVPVLAGTLKHEHRPIRLGAILSFVALGPDGVRGILQGLEDSDREIQDLVFGIIVARDVALARAGHPPDLLLSALASAHPEIRYAACRCLELRSAADELGALAAQLVGPIQPEKAADMVKWPSETERASLLNVLVGTLASDHPSKRYAAARVLSLRPQPEAFWREVKRLSGPAVAGQGGDAPYTSWEDDPERQPRKRDWLRKVVGRRSEAGRAASETERVLTILRFAAAPQPRAVPAREAASERQYAGLLFGAYAGLVRQAPPAGDADETHRVRRDAIERLTELAAAEGIGRDAALPALRRALSDPHHLVRKAALTALQSLYQESALSPLALALQSEAVDIGRAAFDEILALALAEDGEQKDQAASLAKRALDAPNAELRAYALGRLHRLYDEGSVEPWLLALSASHADVRLAVVDRLMDARDERVLEALARAMESDHEDLRLRAASALAKRGDGRTVDVLAGLLRSEEGATATRALDALIELAHATSSGESSAAARAAAAVCARLSDDPTKRRTVARSSMRWGGSAIPKPARRCSSFWQTSRARCASGR
jgi:ParB family chromosome partitioning protein